MDLVQAAKERWLLTQVCQVDYLYKDPKFGIDWSKTESCGAAIVLVWIIPSLVVAWCAWRWFRSSLLLGSSQRQEYSRVVPDADSVEDCDGDDVMAQNTSPTLSMSFKRGSRRSPNRWGYPDETNSESIALAEFDGDDSLKDSDSRKGSNGANMPGEFVNAPFFKFLPSILLWGAVLNAVIGTLRPITKMWGLQLTETGFWLLTVLQFMTKGSILVFAYYTRNQQTTTRKPPRFYLTTASFSCLLASLLDIGYSQRTWGVVFATASAVLSLITTPIAYYILDSSHVSPASLKGAIKRGSSRLGPNIVEQGKGTQWLESRVGWFSFLTFSWLNPLINAARVSQLTEEDLWQLDARDKADGIHDNFQSILSRIAKKEGYLLRALIRLLWKELAFLYTLSLVNHLVIFANPFLIHATLITVQDPSATPFDIGVPVLFIFLFSIARTALEGQLYWVNRRMDAQIRSAVIGAIYVKCLRRRSAVESGVIVKPPKKGKKDEADASISQLTPTMLADGSVMNLMSTDTDLILACFRQSHYAISVPVLVLLCGGLLVWLVGWIGALAGIGALTIAVPATQVLGKVIKRLRKDLMSKSDLRLSKITEMLKGMRTIKLYLWEDFFEESIFKLRGQELIVLSQYLISQSLTNLLWRGSPMVATMATFLISTTFSSSTNPLSPASAFTVLAMFNNVLRYPLFVVPKLVISVMELRVAVGRIEKFMDEPEAIRGRAESGFDGQIGTLSDDGAVLFDVDVESGTTTPQLMRKSVKSVKPPPIGFIGNACLDYGISSSNFDSIESEQGLDKTVLKNLDWEFAAGKLTIIIGPTGCGKSSLLLALLGELRCLHGSVVTPNSEIAYAGQSVWLPNATIRECILFGQPFNESRYQTVLEACALLEDLASMELRDETVVSDKALTLSGGQKQRISLARAFYSQANIILLDDVLSAVDNVTARHIVENCLQGTLSDSRTIILVTNATELCLPIADEVVLMKSGGAIAAAGPVKEIISKAMDRNLLSPLALGEPAESPTMSEKSSPWLVDGKKPKKDSRNEETVKSGRVSFSVYSDFIKYGGGLPIVVLYIGSILLAYVIGVVHDIALKLWSDNAISPKDPSKLPQVSTNETSPLSIVWNYSQSAMGTMGPGLYSIIALLAIASLQLRFFTQIFFSLKASMLMHGRALRSLIHSPMSFFENNPTGRVINRFGKDMKVVDQDVVSAIGEQILQFVNGCTILGMIALASPWLLFAVIPIGILYIPITQRFLALNRPLKRLETVTRSPMFSSFSETFLGVTTYRAFRSEKVGLRNLLDSVNNYHRAFLPLWAINRWLAVRVESIGGLVTLGVGLAIATSRAGWTGGVILDAGWSGLCLSYASMFTDILTWLVRNNATMEMAMTSVERVLEYASLPNEKTLSSTNVDSQKWPSLGEVTIEDLSVTYQNQSNPALQLLGENQTISIKPGERIGVVGRTGAGKSTLCAALVRFIEFNGTIKIDGVDISRVDLPHLRTGITVIPQDAFLFGGTLRQNLDPENRYTDESLLLVLKELDQETLTLDTVVTDGGSNFSAGQRQLIALGRALLRRIACPPSKAGLLVLDEATASLDNETDLRAQKALQNIFRGRAHSDGPSWSLLTIAHRIKTIADSDKIIVLSEGRIVEQGTPRVLLSRGSGSSFARLCAESGELDEIQRLIMK